MSFVSIVPARRARIRAAVVSLSLVVSLLALVLPGCGAHKSGPGGRNLRPHVRLTAGPVAGDSVRYNSTFNWYGWDADGVIVHYQYAIDIPSHFTPEQIDDPNDVGIAWRDTTAFRAAFLFRVTKADSTTGADGRRLPRGRWIGSHTFFVRAVDNEGAVSRAVDLSFNATTVSPRTTITLPRVVTGSSGIQLEGRQVRIAWEGVEAVQGFDAAFLADASGPAVDGVCFADADTASVLRRQVGLGELYTVGGPAPFTNRYLARHDNAVLATALLVDGATVHLVRPRPFGTGDRSLLDLLPDGFYRLMVQLGVALALFVWASAVRLGRPVREPLLLELPSTSFTDSVAQLYQRGGRRAVAAGWLRRRARRELLHRYQLPPDTGVEQLAAVLAAAAGHPEHADRYAAVLRDQEPGSSEELLDVAASIDRLRREVTHGSS